ncbi:Uncharacterized protein HZ326_27393 [Fusarium oxysporum f. sp. albedinis]|nr:Uncharacterized protein HZ326_27393 [Fusarium oxysporum f. sp. albedinis]
MMGEGGSMAVDSIKNNLAVDTFNTLSISSYPFWEQWCSVGHQVLPQSAEGGHFGERLQADSLDHWSDSYPAATFIATPSRQKRKRYSNKNSARKSLRKDSARDSKANRTTGEGGTGRSNRSCGTHGHHGSEHSDQQGKDHSQHIKKRNRIASGKFRAKKREHTLRVQSEEQELERTNHELPIRVANLTREV